MIIGCPGCRTRYLVDEQALGGRVGRIVRCATCGHTWHQKAPRELLAADDFSRFESSRIEPALEVPRRPEVLAEAGLEVPPRPGATPEPSRRPKRGHRGLRWLVLVVFFVLVILAGVVIARGAVVKMWPPAARLFALAGLPVEPPGLGSGRMSDQ